MDGKQVLITGATNGIGLAAAEALAALGANVAMAGRNATAMRIAAARVTRPKRRGATVDTLHCRPLVAGRGAQAGRRGAGPLSQVGCARQQRRRHARDSGK